MAQSASCVYHDKGGKWMDLYLVDDDSALVGRSIKSDREIFLESYGKFGSQVYSNLDEAEKHLEVSSRKAEELGDSLFIAMVLHGRGYLHLQEGRTTLAMESFQRALGITKRNRFTERTLYLVNSLAIAHSINLEYDKALQYHLESLRLRESNGGSGTDISVTLVNIGNVYAELGDFEKAFEYYNKCYLIRNNIRDQENIEYIILNMATARINDHKYIESYKLIEKARTRCDSTNCDARILAEIKLLLGTCKVATGETDEGAALLVDAIPMFKRLRSKNSLSECYYRIASSMLAQKRFESGLRYLV
jgi:tetratricopeptide (TPR) repeat protein